MMPLLYFNAFEQYGNENYKIIALETLGFLSDSLKGASNAFIASLSAVDDKNEEGGFYLWTQSELNKILNKDELKLANHYWNLNRSNELPAGNLPRQAMTLNELTKVLGSKPEATQKLLTSVKTKLKAYREKTRILPRDTKLLTGMNGLVLSAFAKGVEYNPALKSTGAKLAQFLMNLWDGKTLRRSAANAKPGTLYDYAAVSLGLIEWGATSKDGRATKLGQAIAQAAWDKFYVQKSWIENPDNLLPNGAIQAHIADSSLISSEALLLKASILSGQQPLIKKARDVQNIMTRSLEVDSYSFSSLLSLP